MRSVCRTIHRASGRRFHQRPTRQIIGMPRQNATHAATAGSTAKRRPTIPGGPDACTSDLVLFNTPTNSHLRKPAENASDVGSHVSSSTCIEYAAIDPEQGLCAHDVSSPTSTTLTLTSGFVAVVDEASYHGEPAMKQLWASRLCATVKFIDGVLQIEDTWMCRTCWRIDALCSMTPSTSTSAHFNNDPYTPPFVNGLQPTTATPPHPSASPSPGSSPSPAFSPMDIVATTNDSYDVYD
ncbi:hypothetical protein C8Q76DRAFT_696783 [Earliella scabrosa]|nr:hypothetical protein C8Q76DRAFT_696783 [Earliella scabrosa]